MADDPANPNLDATGPDAETRIGGEGVVWFVVGFLLAGAVGTGLGAFAILNDAPVWLAAVAFFAPVVAFFLIFGLVKVPRLLRQMREAARNAPSPESAAARAAGEGVEVGTKVVAAAPDAPDAPDDTPTVRHTETRLGRMLAYRLQRVGAPRSVQFGCAIGMAAFWNGIVAVFVVEAIEKGQRQGNIPWFDVLFLIPFVLIGLVLIAAAILAAVRWFASQLVGRVEVELSGHPLAPGVAVRLHVAQTGLVPLAGVVVALVCTEEATYVAGTSKSSAKKEVAKHALAEAESNPDGAGLPLTANFTVPPEAMHSFEAPNNKINWTIRVTGRVLGLLSFSDDYGVTVAPG